MNIFYLDSDPIECAKMHCDKHVVKMIVEYAQLLSTAHRMLDGTPKQCTTDSGRSITRYYLPDEREEQLYICTHNNHPSAKWVRENHSNYLWLNRLFLSLCDEYTYRYGKVHKTDEKLRGVLTRLPTNIPAGFFTEPPQAMPFTCKMLKAIDGYRRYYIREKYNFCKWTNRQTPEWFTNAFL